MADVFISYCRSDEKSAGRVASALQRSGYSVWWDADLPAHRAYSEVIESHLEEAKAVIVLWSKEAVASQWVRAEADVARNAHKLVQLSLDGTMPPLPFNQLQSASLKGWRGGTSHPGWRKLQDSVSDLVGDDVPKAGMKADKRWWSAPKVGLTAAGIMLLLLAALLLPRYLGGDEERPVVAVLPFETLDKKDTSLVAGIWEDTRQAIGRNPQLLVLGPKTAEEIAKGGTKSATKLADYLVEASVRSAGNRLRISANLVRTKDGSELWSKSFDRQLDDVFALQSEIAGEIEGHIRGRLAQGGGVQPENIATSGEVYALYTDARAKIRRRDSLRYAEARDQLKEVVKMDPNFAPGWATLSIAEQLYGPSTKRSDIGYDRRAAEVHARRAIALAPNLAAGHTALGFALKRGPAAEASLRRAIELDPNDFESINWLAGIYKGRREDKEALALFSRAVKIEPLFWPAVLNRLDLLLDIGDEEAARKEQVRLSQIGDPILEAFAGMEIAKFRNDQSEAARIGLQLLRRKPEESRGIVGFPLFGSLLQLGYVEEARKAFPPPPFGPLLWKNDPRGLEMVEALEMRPEQFFAVHPLPMNAGRVYLLTGRGSELARLYRGAVSEPDQLRVVAGSDLDFVSLAPFIALGLREVGDEAEAQRILAAADHLLRTERLDRKGSQLALRARVSAVLGQSEVALQQLTLAVRQGWIPEPPAMQVDLATDPAFETLKARPAFERVRQTVLKHLAKERAELGAVDVSYLQSVPY